MLQARKISVRHFHSVFAPSIFNYGLSGKGKSWYIVQNEVGKPNVPSPFANKSPLGAEICAKNNHGKNGLTMNTAKDEG
jgi:hypothetical protein